jgi:hypothetical protein
VDVPAAWTGPSGHLFECRWQQAEFGVEVTMRARPEAASAMHDLLEKGLQDGPDVGVVLTRTDTLPGKPGAGRPLPLASPPGRPDVV